MNDTAKLRWGILGAARVNERLLPAIVESGNGRLVAIASRRPGAAAATLAKYAPQIEGVRCYDEPEAILADPEIQAVYLPMANHEHAEWTLKAIAAGKHVLCEKPMALTIADIDAIEQAARQKGVHVMEGFMYRFHPQHRRVQEILQSGAIGAIRTVRASYSFMMRPARMYRLAEPIARGGGAMWDIGCYAIHSLRWFFDHDPVAVTALSRLVDSGADVSSSGVLDYGDGRYAHFDFSFERARRCEYEIVGTQGGLRCEVVWQLPGDVPIVSWWTEGGTATVERLPIANHFTLEVEHFADSVLTGKPPALSFDDARSNCRVILAALESAANGRTVRI